MRQMWGELWKPPAEALDSLTSVLSEHWRKARERTVRLFWPAPIGEKTFVATTTSSRFIILPSRRPVATSLAPAE